MSAALAAEPDALLSELAAASAQHAAAQRLADAALAWRQRLILDAHRADRPHAAIASAAGVSVQAIGKVTRNAGLRRYRQRVLTDELPAELLLP